MKGYVILLLAVIMLMLLIPLPALNRWMDDPADSVPTHTDHVSADRTDESSEAASSAPVTESSVDEIPPTTEPADLFRVLDTDTGTVTEWSERDFLIGTVAGEMYATYHEEALKAQAVAAYTYYSKKRQEQRENPSESLHGADFGDVPETYPAGYTKEGLQQRWGDHFEEYYAKIAAAVDEVLGVTVTYDGELAHTVYHAISGGSTESAQVVWGRDYPYLQPVDSPGDTLSPNYESVVTYSAEEIASALELDAPQDIATWMGECVYSESGTVTELNIGGETFSGTKLRSDLPLRSSCFSVGRNEDSFTFTVHGYGHGVGMSQYGADYMARQGFTWQDILLHYYPGVTIKIP